MKKYEKPVVMINEELAEGVYAASGCYDMKEPVIKQETADGRIDFRIQVDATHLSDAGHSTNGQAIVLTFDKAVKVKEGDGGNDAKVISGDGTTQIKVHYSNLHNPGHVWGFGGLVVNTVDKNATNLQITGYWIECDEM